MSIGRPCAGLHDLRRLHRERVHRRSERRGPYLVGSRGAGRPPADRVVRRRFRREARASRDPTMETFISRCPIPPTRGRHVWRVRRALRWRYAGGRHHWVHRQVDKFHTLHSDKLHLLNRGDNPETASTWQSIATHTCAEHQPIHGPLANRYVVRVAS
jgi:hypothetical protein